MPCSASCKILLIALPPLPLLAILFYFKRFGEGIPSPNICLFDQNFKEENFHSRLFPASWKIRAISTLPEESFIYILMQWRKTEVDLPLPCYSATCCYSLYLFFSGWKRNIFRLIFIQYTIFKYSLKKLNIRIQYISVELGGRGHRLRSILSPC